MGMSSATRRQFLSLIGALGGYSCGISTGGVNPTLKTKKIPVGAHPWVYAATRPNHDIFGILDVIFSDMAYAGVDFVELMHTALEPADAVAKIGELSAHHGLPVIGTSYSAPMWKREEHEKIFEYADGMVEKLRALGCRHVGASVGDARHVKTEEELDAQAEILRRIIRRAEADGITVNLHNHTYEVENEEHDLRGTLARIPEARLGPDIDWLVGAGVDPVEFLNRHGEQVVFAHLRDRGSDGVWTEAMGEGNIDYAAVAGAFRAMNFSGDLAIELAHPTGFPADTSAEGKPQIE